MDWQVGDLAVCVDAAPCRCGDCGGLPMLLSEGRPYVVTEAGDEGWGPFLAFAEQVGPKNCYTCDEFSAGVERFRKVRRDAHEACEAEFVTLLRRSKRKASA
jgi:hypothetical protein